VNDRPEEEEKVSILLVDDRPGNLASLKGVLERPDYELMLAHSGEEALLAILKREFAVILLDVAMPQMDGFEVARIIKQRERFKWIPIIFVTASIENIEWIFEAYRVGAVDFLGKPIDPHAVRAKVAVFVEAYRQRRQIQRQAALLRESERRERELEIARLKLETERRYRNLAEAIPHIIWTAKPSGEVEYFNNRWFATTGRSKADSMASAWQTALHPEDLARFKHRWSEVRNEGSELQMELRLRQADGAYRWYLCHALAEEDADHHVTSWLGTFTDIDEQRRAHDESRVAVRVRDEFLSVAAHELRTPITSLLLQLQTLRRDLDVCDGLEPRIHQKVEAGTRQVRRLANLVSSLLDVSRIATGRLELQIEEFDLCVLVREVLERFGEEAANAKSELRFTGCPQAIGSWDRLRIDQLLSNILSNAIKYAQGKPIDVRMEVTDDGPRVSIEDRGIGIPPEDIDRVFGRFERAVSTRHYGGLGLGLYISEKIAEAHGGRIHLESQVGKGSTFTVQMPWVTVPRSVPLGGESAEPGPPIDAVH
jgi:PAS domain S-box-containing protein